MSYATEAPDATVTPYPLRQRNWNHSARQRLKNHHPVNTRQGFDFSMNLLNLGDAL